MYQELENEIDGCQIILRDERTQNHHQTEDEGEEEEMDPSPFWRTDWKAAWTWKRKFFV